MAELYRKEKELFKILSFADRRLTPKRFEKAIEGLPANYNLDAVVKKLRTIEIDDEEEDREGHEEENEDKDRYPYPYPKKRKKKEEYHPDKEEEKPSMPEIIDGKISIEDLISYLEHLSKFEKRPFDYARCKEILNSGTYIAYKKGSGFSPTIITEGSAILMSI